jgi:hypothetical protein
LEQVTRIVVAGLAPSTSLAPSLSLAPQDTIYAGGPIAPHMIAMGIGAAGAMVDVSAYVEFGEPLGYTYGRPDQFSDVAPGTFGFTLNNSDGRFTPGNPSSPLATTLTEGMRVSWLLGTRLKRFRILSVSIPTDEATAHHLVVSCDDMLGSAARHQLNTLPDDLAQYAGAALMWKLDESDGYSAAETFKNPLGGFTLHRSNPLGTDTPLTFGVEQAPGLPGTAMTLTAAAGETNWFGTLFNNALPKASLTYPTLSDTSQTYRFGFWGMWVYPGSTITLGVTPAYTVGPGVSDAMLLICTPTTVAVKGSISAASTYTYTAAEQTKPHYVTMGISAIWQTSSASWSLFLQLYVDSSFKGSSPMYARKAGVGYTLPTTPDAMSPVVVNLAVTTPSGAAKPLSGTVQRVSHTLKGAALEQNALYDSLDQRRAVLDFIADEISSAPVGALSTATVGFPDVTGSSILDVYNTIIRTEQGHLYSATTGTLLAPVEQLKLRARDRTATPKVSFDGTLEGSGIPEFIRDITNVAAAVEVAGPTTSVSVMDDAVAAAFGRYLSAGVSETVLYTDPDELRAWGQDRIVRGKNVAIRASSFTVDAFTTPTDRTADLLSLVPGDRIRLAGLPASRYGFATWDGWLLGATEQHSANGNVFTFTVSPTLPATAIYDTGRYTSDGAIFVGSSMNNGQTTLVVLGSGAFGANLDGSHLLSTDVPYTIQIESEQLTVTGFTGITATVVRAVNGTTAAAHTVNTPIEVAAPAAIYAY